MLVPESQAAHAPASLELAHAGGVPIVGLTAHETLADILQVSEGELVLITAAAGGVGHLAVQIAKSLGARVVATASAQNLEFVRGLGADTVIDYTAGDPVAAIRAQYPTGVDKALNGVPGEAANQYVAALRDGGHMVDLPGTITVDRPSVRVDTDYVVRADAARLTQLARMFDEGRLKLTVHRTIPFERAQDALEIVLHKHVCGKIVLAVERASAAHCVAGLPLVRAETNGAGSSVRCVAVRPDSGTSSVRVSDVWPRPANGEEHPMNATLGTRNNHGIWTTANSYQQSKQSRKRTA